MELRSTEASAGEIGEHGRRVEVYGRDLSIGISFGLIRCRRSQTTATAGAMAPSKITLGTRGSELARAQTLLVEKAIRTTHPNVEIETKIIATSGDHAKIIDLNAGRKGLFTAEIERALLAGEVDVA